MTKCFYCNCKTTKTRARALKVCGFEDAYKTNDHLVPKSSGEQQIGKVISCFRCNNAKSHYNYEHFLEYAIQHLRVEIGPRLDAKRTRKLFEKWMIEKDISFVKNIK